MITLQTTDYSYLMDPLNELAGGGVNRLLLIYWAIIGWCFINGSMVGA
jgi:hypothetical protein